MAEISGRKTLQTIAHFCTTKYEDLHTTVAFDKGEMESVRSDTGLSISVAGYNKDCVISSKDVEHGK